MSRQAGSDKPKIKEQVFKPSQEVKVKMRSVTRQDFHDLLSRAAKLASRKPSSKSK
jgi:hypothetical protein